MANTKNSSVVAAQEEPSERSSAVAVVAAGKPGFVHKRLAAIVSSSIMKRKTCWCVLWAVTTVCVDNCEFT